MRDFMVVAVILLALAAEPAFAAKLELPDPATGAGSVLFWPVDQRKELLPVEECTVHIWPHGRPHEEARHPCGKWLAPQRGRYNVWLESKLGVSEAPIVFFKGADVERGARVLSPLIPAGTIRLAGEAPAGATFRSVFLDGRPNAGAFERRVSIAEARGGIRMPAGRVLAGIFRPNGDAIALTRPIAVTTHKPAEAVPRPPARGGDLLAVIEAPGTAPMRDLEKLAPAIVRAGVARKPDLLLRARRRIIAVWYVVPPGEYELRAQTQLLTVPVRKVVLEQGRVTTVRSVMQPAAGARNLAQKQP